MVVKRTMIKEGLYFFVVMISLIMMMVMSKEDFSKLPVFGAFGPFVAVTAIFAAVMVMNLVEKIRMKVLTRHGKSETEVYDNTPWLILMLLSLLILYEVNSLVDMLLLGLVNPLLLLAFAEILTLFHLCLYRYEVHRRRMHISYEKMIEEEDGVLNYFRIDDSVKRKEDNTGKHNEEHQGEIIDMKKFKEDKKNDQD